MLQSFSFLNGYVLYLAPLPVAWGVYALMRWRPDLASRSALQAARETGRDIPPSLHPVIDPKRCIGCGACTHICPEGDLLGLIGGKAELIEPSSCIGHGACKAACPVGAIELVFGTSSRGFDIPVVSPQFESSVPGLFIAGELGGMGLIANAIEQGRQAVGAIAKLDGLRKPDRLDLVIVGAGPAGLAASLEAKRLKLRSITLEQDSLGGTVAHYPRGKIIMTRPAHLPLYGRFRAKRIAKEALIAFWQKVVRRTKPAIRYGEHVDAVHPVAGGFEVLAGKTHHLARAVLLATGRRGTPRKLNVPGEDLPKVVYRLEEPQQYRGQRVLVVGGGDSALEAAVRLAEEPGTRVTLSYRGDRLSRARRENREAVDAYARAGRLQVSLASTVAAIEPKSVVVTLAGKHYRLANDAVIICAGGVLPAEFLAEAGIKVETKWGTQ